MKMLRSYHSFVLRSTRWLYLLGIPLVTALLQLWCSANIKVPLGPVLILSMVLIALIMLDQWAFGGCCSKHAGQIDYLRCSVKGKVVLRNALIQDCALRALVIAVLVGICYGVDYCIAGDRLFVPNWGLEALFYGFLLYTFITLGVLISRYSTMFFIGFLTAYLLMQIASGIMLLVFMKMVPVWIPVTVLGLAAVLVTWLCIRNPIRKMERGYYDETIEG